MLPSDVLEIRYYVRADNGSPFAEWFAELDAIARARVARAIAKLQQGNLAQSKGVGEGVLEYKIDFGPGYRVYFGREGDTVVILLIGGTKKHQQRDIEDAHRYWREYKQTKRRRRGTE
ncbi:MAG: type II toxin-antitoxin system RelE/ParE family toxin [Methylobacteriaceae bacterium]|nr:type II toxin-antitoxin system RelE/ParE family toxin [Methylobacteriaceae bacterium]